MGGLKAHVARPGEVKKDLLEMIIAAADAVPIYLHPGTGKLAVGVADLDQKSKRDWAARHPREARYVQVARGEKDRPLVV